MSKIITGTAAIEFAELRGLTLNKYQDPAEGARENISVEEASAVVKEDPSLIWLDVTNEFEAYQWAERQQGFEGEFSDWLELSIRERQQYEDGAAGIPTE